MKTHISQELAIWLKERGCEVESEFYYGVANDGEYCKFSGQKSGDIDIPVGKREGSVQHCIIAEKSEFYPAYSWYDILVTHAKEFWGEELVYECECVGMIPAYEGHSHQVLIYLQNGDLKEAETYVREHSLFSKKSL